MKNILIAIIGGVGVVGILLYFLFSSSIFTTNKQSTVIPQTTPVVTNSATSTTATTTTSEVVTPATRGPKTVIGSSVDGADISAYHYGTGDKEILFIGGIHGGYEWNTSLVAYQLIDYLEANPSAVPAGETITVIPVLNPDGLKTVIGNIGRFTAADVTANNATQIAGRYNANNVDLNRNFACEWQAESKWQNTTVSGGKTAFSEPEAQAIRDYVSVHTPVAVVVWYSAAGGVYSSNCQKGVLPETKTLTDLFANASGYPAHQEFNYYDITGDMVNWLASQDVPAISVLLTNHTDTEWTKNLAGINAIIAHIAN